ncbi:MAG: hypothetical protein JRH10_16560 [Deltaproteobacteria bacterium]|nr:hypothetical protein [Deltaproteobacteria bacterium]
MRAEASHHVGIFLIAAAVLMLEVALTRIFSVMLWNHYTFLVISTALLGFGTAGSIAAISKFDDSAEATRRFLALHCTLFGVATIVCVMLVTRLDVEPAKILADRSNALKMVAMYLLSATPFFFAGLAICRLFTLHAAQINTLYFADLVGAGIGAMAMPFLLENIGAPTTVVLACATGTAAAVAFAGGAGRWLHGGAAAGFLALSAFVLSADPWVVHPPMSKPLRLLEDKILHSQWSLHARIDVLETRKIPLNFGGGVSPDLYRPVAYRTIYMDGSNPSRLIEAGQDPWFLERVVTAGPYQVAKPEPKVLIIGSGGGIDTLVARHHGASHVTAVEINPKTVELVTERFADYIGDPFSEPEVELIAAEGRHFLTLDDGRYDVVRLTGVDTAAAGASAGNALDTAYIYTVEAIRELWEHVAPGGVLGIHRASHWQTRRVVSILAAGLETEGIESLADRTFIVSNKRWSDVIVGKEPFSRAQIAALTAWAKESRLPVYYDPFENRGGELERLVRSTPEERDLLIRVSRANIEPTTDDSPYFFEAISLGALWRYWEGPAVLRTPNSGYLILFLTLIQAGILAAIFIVLPLVRLGGLRGRIAGNGWLIPYFSMLGLGFILVELVFIQKYMIVVGGPARAMSVTLFTVLVFGGLGAYFSQRIALDSRAAVVGSVGAVVGMVLLSLVFLRFGLPTVLGLGATARMAVGILVLAPVSFTLGLPFPLGVRLLERGSPDLVPWAWACNGFLTVIGSVLCLILSMAAGYTAALVLAAVCYGVAAWSVSSACRAQGAA